MEASEAQTGAVQSPNGEQPSESQGGLGDLYDLSSVPEELKPYAENLLSQVNSNVERKFNEAADYRKQWEPYEGIEGFSDLEPDDVRELVEFSQLASDPAKFEEWWTDIGERLGYFPEGQGPEGENGAAAQQGEGDEPPAWAQGLMERLDGLESHVQQGTAAQQQQQLQQEASQWVDTELEKLGDLDDETKDAVCRLAAGYTDEHGAPTDDAIQKGYQDYLKLTGKAQGEIVDSKLTGQPQPGIESGSPDTSAEEFTNLNDEGLKAAAKARFAGAR
jgi:hypothetical protein